jgi:hypothetical protein
MVRTRRIKTYHNKYLSYNKDGRELSDLISQLVSKHIVPVIDDELAKGFSPNELSFIITEEITIRISEKKLSFGMSLRKKEKEINA